MLIWRWENDSRWYEAELCYDLLLIQRWGGLGNQLNDQKTEIVSDMLTGIDIAKFCAVDRQRRKRKNPYHRVAYPYIKSFTERFNKR